MFRPLFDILVEKGVKIMIEQDTIKLLRECDAGVKMGVSAIDDVLGRVRRDTLRERLSQSMADHESLEDELRTLLNNYNDSGKQPNPLAKSFSKMKTNVMMAFKESDKTVADLMTDGCNMGVKSLSKYLNKYQAADERSKDIAKKLIALEEQLSVDMRAYL